MMQFPLIHTNGTCADDLLANQCDIARAMCDAIEVMAANGPHARDYYPLEAGAWERAKEQHAARLKALGAVLLEVEQMAEYLAAEPWTQLEMRKTQ
jgi:hypothetical protein